VYIYFQLKLLQYQNHTINSLQAQFFALFKLRSNAAISNEAVHLVLVLPTEPIETIPSTNSRHRQHSSAISHRG